MGATCRHRPSAVIPCDQKSIRHRDGGKPWPVPVFVSGLSQMSVTLQAAPASVTRHRNYLWDRPTHLEQPRDTFMAQVMKTEIIDLELLACARKRSADRVG